MNRTAIKLYNSEADRLNELMIQLQAKIQSHRPHDDDIHYGHVGDLTHWNRLLSDAIGVE